MLLDNGEKSTLEAGFTELSQMIVQSSKATSVDHSDGLASKSLM